MRRSVLALALTLAAVGAPLFAQDEPPLFENPPAPSPTPATGQQPAQPGTSLGLPSARLDFERWQTMTARERETYVEIAVSIIASLTERLREEAATAKVMPRENLTAVVRLVNQNSPRRASGMYLKEMERIYMTAEGQRLSMADCFQKAFERLNIPASVAPAPQAAKTPAEQPADQ